MNPTAGPFARVRNPERIAVHARQAGVDAVVVPTLSGAQMRRRIRRALVDGRTHIAVAGGDGSVSLAAQEMVGKDAVLGIVPVGTDNNFATSLGIPVGLDPGLHHLRSADARSVSVGRLGDRYFVESAGAGVFADILEHYGHGRRLGLARACAAVIRVLAACPPAQLQVVLDGHRMDQPAGLCVAANASRLGPRVSIAPDASLEDHWLDVVTMDVCGALGVFRALTAMRLGRHLASSTIRHTLAREVRIECATGARVYCDDRVLGKTPARMTVVPAALMVAR